MEFLKVAMTVLSYSDMRCKIYEKFMKVLDLTCWALETYTVCDEIHKRPRPSCTTARLQTTRGLASFIPVYLLDIGIHDIPRLLCHLNTSSIVIQIAFYLPSRAVSLPSCIRNVGSLEEYIHHRHLFDFLTVEHW
jgi:hypothetical protein